MTVIFRLQALWGEQTAAKYISLAMFIVTYGVTLACGGLTVDIIQCKPYLPFDYSPPRSLWLEFNPTPFAQLKSSGSAKSTHAYFP